MGPTHGMLLVGFVATSRSSNYLTTDLKGSCLKNCPPAPSSLGSNFLVLRDESCQLTPVSNATIWHPNWKVQANVERVQWERLSLFFRRNRMKKCKKMQNRAQVMKLRAGLLKNDGSSKRCLLSILIYFGYQFHFHYFGRIGFLQQGWRIRALRLRDIYSTILGDLLVVTTLEISGG